MSIDRRGDEATLRPKISGGHGVSESEVLRAALPRRGVYFGWRIVAALFLCTFALFGVSIYAFVTMTTPMAETYGWSPADTGSLVSAMWLVAPLSLFLGPVISRVGPWRLLMFGFALQALVMALLPLVSESWQAYALRMVMGIGKISMVISLPIILSRWFSRRFGTAMAAVWAGGSAGGMVLAPLTEKLIASYGWHAASLAISGGIVVTMVIVGLLARGASFPADLGLGADGAPIATASTGDSNGVEPAAKMTLGEVLASVNWLTAATMVIAVTGAGIASVGLISQEPTLLLDAGIPPADAATVLGLLAGAGIVGTLSVGWMLDRLPAYFSGLAVGGCMFTGLAAFLLLPHSPSLALSGVGAVSVGAALGGGELLWMALTKRQFGEAAYATTYGGWYLALQVGYAAGGGIAGLTFLHFGSVGFLLFVAVMYIPAAIFSVWRPGIRQ